MRSRSMAIGAIFFAGLCFSTTVRALPSAGVDTGGQENASSAADDTRLFCYNKSSGRFLHWGSCGGGGIRVYCKNRYSGRFLHWGSCY